MDRQAWQDIVHGVTKSRTQLSDFRFHSLDINSVLVVSFFPHCPISYAPPTPTPAISHCPIFPIVDFSLF